MRGDELINANGVIGQAQLLEQCAKGVDRRFHRGLLDMSG